MTYLSAALLGIVQGIAEFLPISSSGHLSLLQTFFGLEEADMLFDVIMHMGTLISVLVVYWRDIVDIVVEFFAAINEMIFSRGRSHTPPPPARRMVLLLIISTLPLFAVPLFKDKVEPLYSNTLFIGFMLLLTGLLLFLADKMGHGSKTERNATIKDAVVVGIAQMCATVPGLSRSATTICAGLFCGFDRRFAVRFSFVMSLPAVLGANMLTLFDAIRASAVDTSMLPMYLVGMVAAMVSGFGAISLIKYLADRNKFGVFSYYCWICGAVAIIATLILR